MSPEELARKCGIDFAISVGSRRKRFTENVATCRINGLHQAWLKVCEANNITDSADLSAIVVNAYYDRMIGKI